MKVLLFCAHPDDEVIAMGGTIKKFANLGAEIRLVHFSPGAEGYATLEEKDKICDIRAKETANVCELLGIGSYHNLQHLDWNIEVDNHSYRQVIEEIREFQPDVVFTHPASDYHDHINVNQVVNEGWFHAPLECAMEQHPVWKEVPLYEFEVIIPQQRPEIIVDITDTFEYKLKAMSLYYSQTGVVGGSAQMLEGRALMRGQLIGVKYGEAFSRSLMRPWKVTDLNKLLD
jgi:LmbE family N-acetylglucosaminyl deacetylase